MSTFFTYVCTRTTADPYIPSKTRSIEILSRDVSDSLLALSGGRLEVGKLAFFPVQRSVPNHLLCDGREIPKASFQELFAYLGESGGVAADPLNFKLPNYLATFVPAPTAVVETTSQGTTSTPPPPADTTTTPAADEYYGDVDSGGRDYGGLVNLE